MLHDPSALEPRCRFQVNSFVFIVQPASEKISVRSQLCLIYDELLINFEYCKLIQEEDSEEYGSPVVSASTIADIIKSRTESLLKITKTAVSPKPIVLKAEYAHCPNLTIIDTPGFVLKVFVVMLE
jgi:hypothetical protein